MINLQVLSLLLLAATIFYIAYWVPEQRALISWRERRYPDLADLKE